MNERIEHVDKAAEEASIAPEKALFEFLCECGGNDSGEIACPEHVHMTVEEYEDVRSQDDRFAVCPGHENEALESVVARSERFLVVDKRPIAEPLVEDDPRKAPSH